MRRRGVVAAVLALMGPLLAACSPGDSPVVALSRSGDQVVVNTSLCPGGYVIGASVEAPGSGTPPEWYVRAPIGSTLEAVTVFATPSGWTLDTSTLTSLNPGTTYRARIDTSGSQYRSGVISFAADQVARLADGQALVPDGDGTRVESLEAFKKAARHVSC